jgi:hypothetical protein
VPGVQEDAEERVAEAPCDDLVQRAAVCRRAARRTTRRPPRSSGPTSRLDVVADPVGSRGASSDHEPGAAVQRPQIPNATGEAVAPFDPAGPGLSSPSVRAVAAGQHQVARQRRRRSIRAGRRPRLAIPARARAIAAGRRSRSARRVLERRQLLDLVDHAAGRRRRPISRSARSRPSRRRAARGARPRDSGTLDRPVRELPSSPPRRPRSPADPLVGQDLAAGATASAAGPGRLKSWNRCTPHRRAPPPAMP